MIPVLAFLPSFLIPVLPFANLKTLPGAFRTNPATFFAAFTGAFWTNPATFFAALTGAFTTLDRKLPVFVRNDPIFYNKKQ